MKVFNIEDINTLEYKTIVTVGMFDGVHAGHRHLLERLADEACRRDLHPIVVTFDVHPRKVTGSMTAPMLLSPGDERMRLLSQCGVDTTVLLPFTKEVASLSACRFAEECLCKRLNMACLLLGYDNSFGNRSNNDFDRLPELAQTLGFSLIHDEPVVVDGVEVSSTKIRNALSQGDMAKAGLLLDRPYSLTGTVVHGRHVGSSLGFPTANIAPLCAEKLVPAPGVYAARCILPGASYLAMVNVGSSPTFHVDKPSIEVHIVGFTGDLYGNTVTVEFLSRIRDVVRFGSAGELSRQLASDRQYIVDNFAQQ